MGYSASGISAVAEVPHNQWLHLLTQSANIIVGLQVAQHVTHHCIIIQAIAQVLRG